MKQISNILEINSNKKLPAFGSKVDNCTDEGSLTIPDKYRTEMTDADFVWIVGIIDTDETYLAYATFCIQGK